MTNRAAMTFLAAVLLAGCAASVTAPRHYLLNYPSLGDAALLSEGASASLLIEQVDVAPFLNSSGIVYQVAENKISIASQHRWAEPIERQLRRSLYTVLLGRLDSVAVFVHPGSARPPTARLSVSLHAFHGRYTGDAVIAGTWWLTAAGGEILVRRRFRVVRPLPADGYDALVQTLSKGWQDIAAGIARYVESALTPDSGDAAKKPINPVRK